MTSLIVFFGVGKIRVRFCQDGSNFLFELFFGFRFISSIRDWIFVLGLGEIEIVDNKSGWHNVTLVDILHECLNSCVFD